MTPQEAFSRKRLLGMIKQITEDMGDQYNEDALDPLVHDCFSEQASEINNSGRPAQLEALLKNGWTPEDILGRLKNPAWGEDEEEDA